MKEIAVNINKSEILTAIKRITANAAQQRDDDLHMATDDNEDLLDGFYDEVVGALALLFCDKKKVYKWERGVSLTHETI